MKTLSGITVIDLTESVSGPYCTMMMGDLGADVIKVEKIGTGDPVRTSAPVIRGGNPVFTAYNRNKKSIALDLNIPDGVKVVKMLLNKADILIDSFKPGIMERLGLNYEALKEKYPKLICVSLTGFGAEGPYCGRPVYEGTIQAESGMTQSLINDSLGTPYYVGGNIAGYASAYFCLIATLAAVHQARVTGQGQKVESNMYGSLVAMFSLPINDYLFNGVERPIDGNAPEGFIRSKDGWLRVSCGDQPIWERAVKLMDDPIMNEARFTDPAVREKHRGLLLERMEKWSLKFTSEEAVKLFTETGISGGIVRTMDDLKEDPHLMARRGITEIEVEELGRLPYFATPFRIKGMTVDYNRAPTLGQNTDEILSDYLKLDGSEITEMRERHVVG